MVNYFLYRNLITSCTTSGIVLFTVFTSPSFCSYLLLLLCIASSLPLAEPLVYVGPAPLSFALFLCFSSVGISTSECQALAAARSVPRLNTSSGRNIATSV